MDGRTIDVGARCSERTFECVEAGGSAEFLVRDPSNAELAASLGREAARAEDAASDAADAGSTANIALALAAAALVASIGLGVRRRGRRGAP